jgi:hypothetical protein|nr:MAG TPA: hypothetical protein [Caudoviricetes sp.]
MILNTNAELGGLDALGVADTIIASLLLNYSEKSYRLNLDNTSENKKVISLLNEINENEKTIISLLQRIIEDDKH